MFSARPKVLVLHLAAFAAVSYLASQKTLSASDPYAELQEHEILQRYVAVSDQPVSERLQLMQKLSAAEKSYLWRIHLAMYVTQHIDLNKDQQSVVVDALALATPQLFASPDPSDVTWPTRFLEPVDQLRQRSLSLFPRTEAAEIFATFGARPQEADSLRKYAALSEMGRADRKAAFAQMSAEDKSDLWHVHFALNLARHVGWTEPQRAVVLEAISFVTPRLYQIPRDERWTEVVDRPVRLLVDKALLVFTRPEAAGLFAELGGKLPVAHHSNRRETVTCTCSRSSDWCTYDCWSDNCTSTWGCGTLGLYRCDGLCYEPPNIN